MDQYNKELTTVTEKLQQESNLREKAQKDRDSLEVELTTLQEQIEKANANAVVDFKASQSFIDACAIYYGDSFDDCLKQVGFVYPDLDLSEISMDDPVPTTPAGGDIVSKETDDSTYSEQDPKDDGMVLAQPTLEGPVVPLVLSAKYPPLNDVENPST